ncbi:MAG: hypothetical protein ABW060_15385 [Solirubrobacteraceae bacterium]
MLLAVLTVLGWAVAAAPAAAQWGDAPFPVEDGARCPFVAGEGRLSALGLGGREVTLWRTLPGGGVAPAGGLALPAAALECPAVAVAADGSALVAVVVDGERPRLLVLRRRAAGPFAVLVQKRVSPLTEAKPAVAASPGGGGAVVWSEARYRRGGRVRVAVRAMRVVADADNAPPPVALLEPRWSDTMLEEPEVVAAADAAGRAFVAWTTPRPPKRDGRVSGLAAVDLAVAPAGLPFGAPQRVSDNRQDVADLALAAAGEGRALLAHDGTGGVEVFERGADGRFAAVLRRGGGAGAPPYASRPAVALNADGSAVVAWREDGRVDAVRRVGAGGFGAPATVGSEGPDRVFGGVAEAIVSGVAGITRDEEALDAAVAPGGAAAISWIVRPAFAGAPIRAAMATAAGGAFTPPATIGGPIRDIRALAPFIDADGPAVLWSDDRSPTFLFALRSARVHLSRPARPRPDLPPPELEVTGHARALFPGQSLRLTLRCSASCEVRARIPSKRRIGTPSVGVGGRIGAGAVVLRVRRYSDANLARRSGRVPVSLDVAAPGGVRTAERRVRLEVARRPLPPLRPPADLRARRHGDDVIVTWRTAGPARRTSFYVTSSASGKGTPGRRSAAEIVAGRGRTRFSARLRDVPAGHRHVAVIASQLTRAVRRVAPVGQPRQELAA